MTLTLTWWMLPTALVIIGFLALLVCSIWAHSQGGGLLEGFFEGLLGVVIALLCFAAAAGIWIGRWLA